MHARKRLPKNLAAVKQPYGKRLNGCILPEKKTIHYREQEPEKVKEYQVEIAGLAPEQIAYVDETGIDTYLYREYGYAPRDRKVNAAVSGHKYKRVGIVAAQLGKEIISSLTFSDAMDSSLPEYWFEHQLLPALPSDAVVVMDNASFHRRTQLIRIAQKRGCRLIFLPPYSPELNPIENFWAWLQHYLRSDLPSAFSFDDASLMLFKCVNYTVSLFIDVPLSKGGGSAFGGRWCPKPNKPAD